MPELVTLSLGLHLVMWFRMSGTVVALLSTVILCLSSKCLLMFPLDVTVEKFATLLI